MSVNVYVNQQLNALEDGVATRVTLPKKPPRLVMVTTVCLSEPTGIAREVALSVMEKSAVAKLTVTLRIVDWVMLPLIPVMVIEYVPESVEFSVDTVSVAVVTVPFDRATVPGLI